MCAECQTGQLHRKQLGDSLSTNNLQQGPSQWHALNMTFPHPCFHMRWDWTIFQSSAASVWRCPIDQAPLSLTTLTISSKRLLVGPQGTLPPCFSYSRILGLENLKERVVHTLAFPFPDEYDDKQPLTSKEEEERRIAEMGRPILGEHTKLEVIIEESYEFKVSLSTLPAPSAGSRWFGMVCALRAFRGHWEMWFHVQAHSLKDCQIQFENVELAENQEILYSKQHHSHSPAGGMHCDEVRTIPWKEGFVWRRQKNWEILMH